MKVIKMQPLRPTQLVLQQSEIEIATRECLQFIDITEKVEEEVRNSGLDTGIVSLQCKHTTAALIINEHEPLLLQDMKRVLENIAPRSAIYGHDDFSVRTVNLGPDEDQNGHSHCKALFLPTSQYVHVAAGRLLLGTWQRIFLLELDRGKRRSISVSMIGT